MAWAEVGSGTQQQTIRAGPVATATAAFPANVTLDSLVVLIGGVWSDNGYTSVTVTKDSGTGAVAGGFTTILGNTGVSYSGGVGRPFIAYGIVTTAGSLTVKVATDVGTATNYYSSCTDEFSGGNTSSILDVDGGELTIASGQPVDSITTLTASDLILNVHISSAVQNPTPGSGYTEIDEDTTPTYQMQASEFQIVGAPGAYAADWSIPLDSAFSIVNAAFKASGATPTTAQLMPAVTGQTATGEMIGKMWE